jgi:hypothetical protein
MLKLSRPILLALLLSALMVMEVCAQTAEAARAELARRRLIFDLMSEEKKRETIAGFIDAALGDKDQAFQWLEKAYEERDTWLVHLKIDPMLDSLRLDPRYANLLARINLAA